jgi:hypothetical protein
LPGVPVVSFWGPPAQSHAYCEVPFETKICTHAHGLFDESKEDEEEVVGRNPPPPP